MNASGDAVLEEWTAQGRWCPPDYPQHKQRVRYPIPSDGIPGLPPRRRVQWTDPDACAEALAEFWDTLPSRKEPTQKTYGKWAVGKPYPAPNVFLKHGGFTAVKERARRLRKRR